MEAMSSPLGTDAPNVVGLVYIAAFGLDEVSRSARCYSSVLLHKVFTKLDITSRIQLARVPPSHLNTWQIGD